MRIRSAFKIISLPLTMAALFACSNGSGTAPTITDANGKHAASTAAWVQQHWVAYNQSVKTPLPVYPAAGYGVPVFPDSSVCAECHGADLDGGTSKVSCFQASFDGVACHPNADHKLGHPTGWGNHIAAGFHGYSTASADPNAKGVKGSKTLVTCQQCHATGDAGIASVSSAPVARICRP